MEDHEDTQDFDEYALPDILPPDSGKKYLIRMEMNLLRKKGISKVIINLIQCMLTLHTINSKR